MSEQLDNLPEELYAEHKDLAKELGDISIKQYEDLLSEKQEEVIGIVTSKLVAIRNDAGPMVGKIGEDETKNWRPGRIMEKADEGISYLQSLIHKSQDARKAMAEKPEVEKKYRQNVELAGAHKDIHYEEYVDQAKKEAAERGIHIDTHDNPDSPPGGEK